MRKILYLVDTDKTETLTVAHLVLTRAPMELQAEECRYAALSVKASGAASKKAPAKGGAKGSATKCSFCFNWAKGLPCAPSSLDKNGIR